MVPITTKVVMLKEKREYMIDRFYKQFSEETKSSKKQYSKKDRRENRVRLQQKDFFEDSENNC
jgi:hypothetical protein